MHEYMFKVIIKHATSAYAVAELLGIQNRESHFVIDYNVVWENIGSYLLEMIFNRSSLYQRQTTAKTFFTS